MSLLQNQSLPPKAAKKTAPDNQVSRPPSVLFEFGFAHQVSRAHRAPTEKKITLLAELLDFIEIVSAIFMQIVELHEQNDDL